MRVAQIIDGTVVEVELTPPELRPPTLAAIGRTKERLRIKGCTLCPLHQHCGGPVPFSYPAEPPRFAVLGEGPGPDEDRVGQPFVGKSGRLLRAMMSEAGLPEPAFVNVVSCFPNNAGRVRPPSAGEIEACRDNMLRQIEATGCQYIILAGAVATNQWRSDLTVTEARGQMFVWMRRWVVMPVTHPAALLRNPSEARRAEMKADLARFRDMIDNDDGLGDLWRLGDQCIKCGGWVTHYDEEGVGWCSTHWETFKVKVKKAQQRLRGKKDIPGQVTLI